MISGLILVFALWAIHLFLQYVASAWDHDRVEKILSADLHRQVRLGTIDWRVGWHGLNFISDRMSIDDEKTGPLLKVKKTQINFAIVPLLKGELLPKRIELVEPEFWAERLPENHWNFSDLTEKGEFYRLLHAKVTDGTLHLVDRRSQTASRYRQTEFELINFELDRPF